MLQTGGTSQKYHKLWYYSNTLAEILKIDHQQR